MNPETQATIHSVYQEGLSNGIASLHGWRRVVYLVVELETYYDMEGLEGFYRSKLRTHASEAANALETIGAAKSAQLIKRANTLLATTVKVEDPFDVFDENQIAQFDASAAAFASDPDRRSQRLEEFVTRTSGSSV